MSAKTHTPEQQAAILREYRKRLELHHHSASSRALVRVTRERGHYRGPLASFKPPRDAADHPQLWPWVVDHRRDGYPENTRARAAKELCRFLGGIHSKPRMTRKGEDSVNTRLWFYRLADVVFAAAWPGAASGRAPTCTAR